MKNKTTLIIWILVAIGIAIVFMLELQKKNNRVREAVVATGVIVKKGKRAKGERYVAYAFSADGKSFYGTMSIKFCNECDTNCCAIGSKVKVRYEKGNPENNDLIH